MASLLEGRVALVTGAGGGLGRAIALALSRAGAAVAAADLDLDAAAITAAAVRAHARGAVELALDVADPSAAAAAVTSTANHLGRLDVLVNSAGVIRIQELLDITPGDWDDVFAVNARGVFFCLQAAARQMRRQGTGGAIINIASISGRVGRPLQLVYAASKAAVISLTRSAALGLASEAIRVNAICPGIVDTPMWAEVDQQMARLSGLQPGAFTSSRRDLVPLGRFQTAEDIAELVVFLASEHAKNVTGQAWNVDGGLVLS